MDSNKLNQLLLLENRMLEDRRKLVELTSDINSCDSELARQKITMLEHELDYMSRQIRYIKGAYENPAQVKTVEMNQQVLKPVGAGSQAVKPQETKTVGVTPWYVRPGYEQNLGPMSKTSQIIEPVMQDREMPDAVMPDIKYNKADGDFEKAFGKSFMGIAGSVLVFISLILIATLLLPYLDDAAKMVIMYLVSFTFLGIGAYRLNNDNKNKFNIALTGCGLGALFISLLLSNIYFRILGDIPLYVLIAFWGGLVCLFAKKKNYIFQIIGEVGILIATIFGCVLCLEKEDPGRFLALLIFYGITSAIFYLVNYEKELEENLCYHLFAVVGSVIISTASMAFDGDKQLICWIFTMVILALNIIGIMTHKSEKAPWYFGIISSIYMILMALILAFIVDHEDIWAIIVYVAGMTMVFGLSIKKDKVHEGKMILSSTSIVIALVGLCINGPAYYNGVVWLIIIPFIIYGYVRNYNFCKYAGLLIMTMYLFAYNYDDSVLHFVFMLASLIVTYVCMFVYKKQYIKLLKHFLHVISLVLIGIFMSGVLKELIGDARSNEEIIWTIVYICFFALNTICYKSNFACDFATGEKEKDDKVYLIANMIAMAAGLVLIGESISVGCYVINLLIALAAFLLKSKSILDDEEAGIAGNIYVGGKFTVFLFAVLSSLNAVNYVVSITFLLLAILFILIGFIGEYKYIRIYGLVLTMISIFKLVMLDIKYENTLGNAISFFVSGVLCFAISMIYNYLDKKIGEEEK